MDGVIWVIPNQILKMHTTGSWDFMALGPKDKDSSLLQFAREDVIIGFMDSAVLWSESESFNDNGIGPVPFKWKGKGNFTCDKKIVGARYYNSANFYSEADFRSPRDSISCGTHTASTLKGLSVNKFTMNGAYLLIRGGDAANYSAGPDPDIAKFCFDGSLNSFIAVGKIVFCETIRDWSGVLLANGVGTVMAN